MIEYEEEYNSEELYQEATLLEDEFDPEQVLANPGLYVASSGTPAYPLLFAMEIVGDVMLVGERFQEESKIITVLVGDGSSEVQANPAIGIGREFFVTALKDYQNWKEKWWREVVQNAIDAGANKIRLESSENSDGTFTVSCEDNGGGMTEDILINKFLVLGGTTKTGASGTAGGFGKAKELLVLPWISWEIHTQNTVVSGSGIQYEVARTGDFLEGTKITVVMPADEHTYDAPAISFLKKCFLPEINFTVNGTKVKADMDPGKPIRELSGKALAYYLKGDFESSQMLVRAKGNKFVGSLFMFDQYLSDGVKGYVIVELLGPSIQLLTANRDGFRDWELRRDVQGLANEIASDVKSALRSKSGMIRKKYEGTGKFKANIKNTQANLIMAVGEISSGEQISDQAIENAKQMLENERRSEPEIPGGHWQGVINDELAEMLLKLKFRGPTQVESALKQLVWRPDFFLVNEIEDVKIPAKFQPENMTPTVLKLVKVWTELCRFVLVQLGCGLPFGVGFIFSNDVAATYLDENNEHWLMLNPIFHDRQLNSESFEDLNLLYELAIHEVTHMADGISYHNEAFASALTFNNAKCADGWRKIRSIAGSIKLKKQEEFREIEA